MNVLILNILTLLFVPEEESKLIEYLPRTTQTVVVLSDIQLALKVLGDASSQATRVAFEETFGVELEDLGRLTIGAFLRAELEVKDVAHGEIILARRSDGAVAALALLHQRLLNSGARLESKTFRAFQAVVVTRRSRSGQELVSVHMIFGKLILFANSVAAADSVLQEVDSEGSQGLTRYMAFAEVWRHRLPEDSSQPTLRMDWYSDSRRRLTRGPAAGQAAPGSFSASPFASRYGMDGIKAIGGTAIIGENGNAVESQSFAYTPQPLTKAVGMANSLTDAEHLAVPRWVSEPTSQVLVFHGDVAKAFDSAGQLFDDGFADGVEGTYEDVLADLKELLNLDLKQDLYPQLGPHVVTLVGASRTDRTWLSRLLAFEVRDSNRVLRILQALIADDPAAQELQLNGDSNRVWLVPGEGGAPDFVMGMLHGYAIYANDIQFAKSAMGFDNSQTLLNSEIVSQLLETVAGRIQQQPSMLFAQRETPAGDRNSRSQRLLKFAFEGTRTWFDNQDLNASEPFGSLGVVDLIPLQSLVFGFKRPHGWLFVSPKLDSNDRRSSARVPRLELNGLQQSAGVGGPKSEQRDGIEVGAPVKSGAKPMPEDELPNESKQKDS